MGTNYYLRRTNELDLHIGKSSAGWCFALHAIPELDLVSLETWIPCLLDGRIYDEYGKPWTFEALLRQITKRAWLRPKVSDEWNRANQAEPGPKGLARHVIDQTHCIGHGPGTWDLITGKFS